MKHVELGMVKHFSVEAAKQSARMSESVAEAAVIWVKVTGSSAHCNRFAPNNYSSNRNSSV